VAVRLHAGQQAGLWEYRQVRGVAALDLDEDLRLELVGAVVLDRDTRALGELRPRLLELVGLLVGDRRGDRDGLAAQVAVLLEVGAVGAPRTLTATAGVAAEVVTGATGQSQRQRRSAHDQRSTALGLRSLHCLQVPLGLPRRGATLNVEDGTRAVKHLI